MAATTPRRTTAPSKGRWWGSFRSVCLSGGIWGARARCLAMRMQLIPKWLIPGPIGEVLQVGALPRLILRGPPIAGIAGHHAPVVGALACPWRGPRPQEWTETGAEAHLQGSTSS